MYVGIGRRKGEQAVEEAWTILKNKRSRQRVEEEQDGAAICAHRQKIQWPRREWLQYLFLEKKLCHKRCCFTKKDVQGLGLVSEKAEELYLFLVNTVVCDANMEPEALEVLTRDGRVNQLKKSREAISVSSVAENAF